MSINFIAASISGIALLVSQGVMAFEDDQVQLSKQIKAHQRAEARMLAAFSKGDEEALYSEVFNVNASEAYLSILDFSPRDPRLIGHLFDEELQSSPNSVNGFVSKVFHHRLKERTGFEPRIGQVLTSMSFSGIKFTAE